MQMNFRTSNNNHNWATYGGPWLATVCVGETDNGPIDDDGVW